MIVTLVIIGIIQVLNAGTRNAEGVIIVACAGNDLQLSQDIGAVLDVRQRQEGDQDGDDRTSCDETQHW